MYLLPLGLSKDVHAGTSSMFFTIRNVLKAVPWPSLVRPGYNVWIVTTDLLVITALKLLWDGVHGYLS